MYKKKIINVCDSEQCACVACRERVVHVGNVSHSGVILFKLESHFCWNHLPKLSDQ